MHKIGERVGAILSGEGDTCYFIGYGIYEGDFIPESNIGGFGKLLKEVGITNPRIKLDNGGYVYGCECWWGAEDSIRERLKNFKNIVLVDMEAKRKKD